MASPKNSARRKRKYTDKRKATTDANRKADQRSSDLRQARMVARTQALIGQHVKVRVKDQIKPLVGTVLEVLRKGDEGYPVAFHPKLEPTGAKRKYGAYLNVRTSMGDFKVSRHRVKGHHDQ